MNTMQNYYVVHFEVFKVVIMSYDVTIKTACTVHILTFPQASEVS